jgi:hypothetical protein
MAVQHKSTALVQAAPMPVVLREAELTGRSPFAADGGCSPPPPPRTVTRSTFVVNWWWNASSWP